MTEYLRSDWNNLKTIAMQVGLTPEEAQTALEIGARLVVQGFSFEDSQRMVQDYYRQRREAYERWGL